MSSPAARSPWSTTRVDRDKGMQKLCSITPSITTKQSNRDLCHSKHICREFNGLRYYFLCRFTTSESQKAENPTVSLGRYFPHAHRNAVHAGSGHPHGDGAHVHQSTARPFSHLHALCMPKVQIIHGKSSTPMTGRHLPASLSASSLGQRLRSPEVSRSALSICNDHSTTAVLESSPWRCWAPSKPTQSPGTRHIPRKPPDSSPAEPYGAPRSAERRSGSQRAPGSVATGLAPGTGLTHTGQPGALPFRSKQGRVLLCLVGTDLTQLTTACRYPTQPEAHLSPS